MGRFIDFICHADAIFPRGSTDDRMRFVSPTGYEQAYAFGQARAQAGEKYLTAFISDTLRAECTAIGINAFAGPFVFETRKVPELFDPIEPTELSRVREATCAKLGNQSLARYRDECPLAMLDLGQLAHRELGTIIYYEWALPIPPEQDSRILVIGHSVYINEIILSTFIHDLNGQMKNRLLNDPPLQPCAGYRLVFDDDGNLQEMLDLPPIILDA